MISRICAINKMLAPEHIYMQMMQKIYRVINQISDHTDLQAVVSTVKNWSDEWLFSAPQIQYVC